MREFYLNELVTHVVAESPPDPSTLPLSDVIIVKVIVTSGAAEIA